MIKKTLLAAGLAGLAFATPALGADLAFPMPIPEPMIPNIEVGGGQWYLRGDVGTGIQDMDGIDATITSGGGSLAGFARSSKSMDDPTIIGAGLGYQWTDYLRVDLTGEYRSASEWTFTLWNAGTGAGNTYDANIGSAVGLVNAYYDIGNFWGLTPFIGAGAGYGYHFITGFEDNGIGTSAGGYGTAPDESTGEFAWAIHGGASYEVNQNLKLEMSYRYLDLGTINAGEITCLTACGGTVDYDLRNVTSHDMRVGMRWTFGQPTPAAVPMEPEPPVVRKY